MSARRSGPPGGPARSRRQRELGQNFLVDRNILDVIERLAELGSDDVVLEIGGGLGVLSQRLAARVSHLHVVELDARLEQALRDALEPFQNVTLHMEDALSLDLGALEPLPTKVVANLPYSIAATVILRTIDELPDVAGWLVMVQREVGERLAAEPGTPAYGAPSVLAQIACEVKIVRSVPRTVFRPVPRVDSVLVRLRRRDRAAGTQLRKLINDSFAHRRKTLPGSLALAPDWPPDVRERAIDALTAIGHPPNARAEQLSPREFHELIAGLGR